jgi:hypothetical protein
LNQKVEGLLKYGTMQSFGPEKAGQFLPDYGFGCRRSAPVQDFAVSIQQPNVDIIQASVVGFNETGIVDSNGNTTDVDICVCATSFHPAVPMFDIIGRNGRNLGKEIPVHGKSYLSIMNEGFPNLFCTSRSSTHHLYTKKSADHSADICSTNAPGNHGSFLPMLEWYVRYAMKIITHMQRTSIRSFVPKAAAQEDYYVWSHQLMKRLTVSQPCHSWFKSGKDHGPVTAVYAGSRAHFYEALKEPRYEDLEIDYTGVNRFEFMGNGFTRAEITPDSDFVWYLGVLKNENKQGFDAFDINPVRPRHPPADETIVIPKSSASIAPRL